MNISSRIAVILLSFLLTIALATCGFLFWLTSQMDEAVAGQLTIVKVLESHLAEGQYDLSMPTFKERLEELFPNHEVIQTDDTLEVCGAVFLFRDGIYYGSHSVP